MPVELPRCPKHRKLCYTSAGKADIGRRESIRAGADPGLEVYQCWRTKSWHIGHRGRWRSLERLMNAGRGKAWERR